LVSSSGARSQNNGERTVQDMSSNPLIKGTVMAVVGVMGGVAAFYADITPFAAADWGVGRFVGAIAGVTVNQRMSRGPLASLTKATGAALGGVTGFIPYGPAGFVVGTWAGAVTADILVPKGLPEMY